MKLKLDENGNAIIKNGYPVYLDHKDEEIAVDVNELYKTVGTLKEEAKSHRLKAKDYKASLTVFDGIEDLEKFRKEAEEAMQKVADFDSKDLIAADKVAALKGEWEKSAESIRVKLTEESEGKDKVISKKDKDIRKLLVSNAFATSAFFSGKEPKTILLPDIAEARFGHHVQIEEDSNGIPQAVLYTAAGGVITSIKNPGQNASFDEGMSEIIDQYPGKDRILPAGNSGSGASHGNKTTIPLSGIKALQEQHAAAMKSGNMVAAIAIKNQIAAEQNK